MAAARWRVIGIIAAGLLLATAAGGWFWYRPWAEQRRVIAAVNLYNEVVPDAYARLDDSRLSSVADLAEANRIATYMVKLEGEGTRVDTEIIGFEVVEYRSEAPTYTVRTVERWRTSERDSESGALKAGPITERNDMTYTLVKSKSGILVHRSELTDRRVEETE